MCVRAVESCAAAFDTWKNSHPTERRRLFNRLAQLLRERGEEIKTLVQEEISCTALWAQINLQDSIALAEECAAIVTSGVLSGVIPTVVDPEAHAVVIKEPLGVVLGIAPWNAPLILGLRAIAAAVAAGNTAILKGSEISPRTHSLIARLFQEAGFPSGVVNYIQHRPKDAAGCFEAMISHKAVQKCNFTGSTPVGRHVAQRAGFYLKPVILELGGKNFAIVAEDADLDKAADMVLVGAFLNSGQICMSTDTVLVHRSIEQAFRALLRQKLSGASKHVVKTINAKSEARIEGLIKNAKTEGATVKSDNVQKTVPAVLIEDVCQRMDFWTAESFGPLLGLALYDDEEEAVRMVNSTSFGLSGAIFSRDHLRALKLARRLQTGAVHVNSPTVHDEATLPHGGRKESGWGRFGSFWGFEEFLQTKTVILHP
ncbi:hypothetical protein SLS60_010025 [Paraconiothyrium brasiliense]|uniref:Aldehyde dehydrogenase domain-containing protein n=1 Tax=Paraconiothyrium brasiliense TaxID=300254 RepID=A0ABR3QTX2_9PLEO